jgi:glycosyltransferase involved in cell wall biosynthesis
MLLHPKNISILVPTKNEEKNIGRFLSYIPKHFSLIAIDAIVDSTPHLILSKGRASKKVIHFNGNISQARQLGAEVADTGRILSETIKRFLRRNAMGHLHKIADRSHPADIARVFHSLTSTQRREPFDSIDGNENKGHGLSELDKDDDSD